MSKNEEVSEPNWKDRIAVKYTKVKNHVRKNKKTYAVGTAGAVLTLVTFVVTKRVTRQYLYAGETLNIIRPSSILSKQQNTVNTNTIKVFTDGRGRPGNYVHLFGRPDISYPSQTQAAKIFGVSDKTMSLHLNGILPDVNGYRLVRPVI